MTITIIMYRKNEIFDLENFSYNGNCTKFKHMNFSMVNNYIIEVVWLETVYRYMCLWDSRLKYEQLKAAMLILNEQSKAAKAQEWSAGSKSSPFRSLSLQAISGCCQQQGCEGNLWQCYVAITWVPPFTVTLQLLSYSWPPYMYLFVYVHGSREYISPFRTPWPSTCFAFCSFLI